MHFKCYLNDCYLVIWRPNCVSNLRALCHLFDNNLEDRYTSAHALHSDDGNGQSQRQRQRESLNVYISHWTMHNIAHDIENQWMKSFFFFHSTRAQPKLWMVIIIVMWCGRIQQEKIKSIYRFLPSVSCQGLNCMHERMRLNTHTHTINYLLLLDNGDRLAGYFVNVKRITCSYILDELLKKKSFLVRCIARPC